MYRYEESMEPYRWGNKKHEPHRRDSWALNSEVGVDIDLGDPWIVIKWHIVTCILLFIDIHYVDVIGEIKHRIGQWDSVAVILNPVHAFGSLIRKDKNNKI
jgi:hypothetical protein